MKLQILAKLLFSYYKDTYTVTAPIGQLLITDLVSEEFYVNEL